jgi:hypothetical protein
MSEEIFFNFGDLVRVDGYWPRVFKVDGYHIDTWHYPNESWTETVYDLVDAYTGEFLEADVDDLTLAETADKAEEYLAANPTDYEAPTPNIPDWMTFLIGGEETMKKKPDEPKKPSARELSAQIAEERKVLRKKRAAEIDNLLDQRNWYADMLAKTNDETYGDRLVCGGGRAELKRMVETE